MSGGFHDASSANPFNLHELLGNALLEHSVPRREFGRLDFHSIMQFLDSEHGAHACNQRCVVDRFCQIFAGACVESGDDVL